MIELIVAAWLIAPHDPQTPTTPPLPPLPTYIVKGDGGKLMCTPNYEHCWEERG